MGEAFIIMKTNIKRMPFGKNGIEVSEVSFGAMNLRMLKDVGLAKKLINDILDQGVNCIDTARAYDSKAGEEPAISSESLLGEVISSREDIDEPLLIITKGHGYDPENYVKDYNESVRRLRIIRKDGKMFIGKTEIRLCYLLHGISADRWTTITSSGALDFAMREKAEGRINFFGFSSHNNDGETIKKAIETGKFNACELPYNVYSDNLGEGGPVDLIKLASEHGMGVINMKAYNGSGSVAIFKQLSNLTGIGYVDMTRFCLSNPYVSTIDAGVRSLGEYLENASASGMPALTAAERKEMRDRASRVSPYLRTICRECMHCVEKFECPQGVNFPKMLGTHGRYQVSKSLGFDTTAYKNEFIAAANAGKNSATGKNGECIRCGECLPWCEYHLDIPEMLVAAHSDLD